MRLMRNSIDISFFSDLLLASTVLTSEMYQSSLHPFKYSLLIRCPEDHTQGLFVCACLCTRKEDERIYKYITPVLFSLPSVDIRLWGRLMEYAVLYGVTSLFLLFSGVRKAVLWLKVTDSDAVCAWKPSVMWKAKPQGGCKCILYDSSDWSVAISHGLMKTVEIPSFGMGKKNCLASALHEGGGVRKWAVMSWNSLETYSISERSSFVSLNFCVSDQGEKKQKTASEYHWPWQSDVLPGHYAGVNVSHFSVWGHRAPRRHWRWFWEGWGEGALRSRDKADFHGTEKHALLEVRSVCVIAAKPSVGSSQVSQTTFQVWEPSRLTDGCNDIQANAKGYSLHPYCKTCGFILLYTSKGWYDIKRCV